MSKILSAPLSEKQLRGFKLYTFEHNIESICPFLLIECDLNLDLENSDRAIKRT